MNINPREIVSQVLMDIEKDGKFSNIALKKALKANGAMPSKDRAFVTEVVNGTLRNIIYIDYCVNSFSSVKTENMKPWVLAVLRSAVYQIIFMSVPKSAATDEAVKLIKRKNLGGLSGFVNAVLRKISTNWDKVELPDEDKNTAEYISIKYSHPLWIVKMWINAYGSDFTKKLCMADTLPEPVNICTNTLKCKSDELEGILKKDGMNVQRGHFLKNTLIISKTGDISKNKAFVDGYFNVQDESSSFAVDILAPKSGENILDVCAAPGGKSVLAAEIMENNGKIVARDIFNHRLALIDDTAERLGIDIIKTENKDAMVFDKNDEFKFDRVLVDVPCSGLGLMRKKADIRLKKNGNDIDTLLPLQKKILETSSRYVKKGGIMVFSTCTICKKENIGNLKWILENLPFEECELSLPKGIETVDGYKCAVQLFPNIHGTDGFFIAKLRRKEI
ncbi:MAG: 16S rRNA (cytosine(967)-C(5))-methyltransferase RsmB [Clostridia bacterium]|jgi:16S rRNA (cytosine967-C5)-methyltransferase|nr:16S rRNA (cytosine(967)-C(5))-methyltransferase RsmB [Clostridia bacterium]MCI2013839.1 16S rRNA (cytosine(967)-C(5))-methyltransferase RsmB [Clostridia bacterium]